MSPPLRRELVLIAAAIVVLAAVLPYLSTLHNYFVQDDFGVVQLLARKPWSYFPTWFTTPWMDDIWGYIPDEIRPFPAVTYQVTALWGAANPVANHIVNIAFHAANALLVLAVARAAAGLSLPSATFAALVFALMPIQTESVAWITGRVDSMPAFFYLASFLAYVRSRDAAYYGTRARSRTVMLYVASLVLFFVALFTKQNTITMAPALLLFDWLVALRRPWLSRDAGGSRGSTRAAGLPASVASARVTMSAMWSWAWWYVPFTLMTIGYLALRLVVFGEVARESSMTRQGFEFFGTLVKRHLTRMVFGDVSLGSLAHWIGVVVAAFAVWLVVRVIGSDAGSNANTAPYARADVRHRAGLWGTWFYFGPVWLFFGSAPTLVANYESPRHIYLAAVGWAILLGLACDRLWHAAPRRLFRGVAIAASLAVLAAYTQQLRASVADWNLRAQVSQRAVADLERTANALPEGSLIIAGAPISSWEWALPFAAQPPYTKTDLMARVSIVTPWRLLCCRAQWEGYTRRTLQTWAARADHPPVVALYWDPRSGAVSTLSDREEPFLRALIPVLLETRTYDVLDARMLEILNRAVAGR
jgi:hypothetical protein